MKQQEVEALKRKQAQIEEYLERGMFNLALAPLRERAPNGRDTPIEHRDALDITPDEDLLDDVLESDVLVYMKGPPPDMLDHELHLEICRPCAQHYGRLKLCAHCLEERTCTRIPVHDPLPARLFQRQHDELEALLLMPIIKTLWLCRPCRTRAHNGALDLRE